MRYNRRKKRDINTYHRKNQPCWTCQNCYGGCSWSREFKPVNGWIATPSYIASNEEYADTYKITYCPEYKEDIRT